VQTEQCTDGPASDPADLVGRVRSLPGSIVVVYAEQRPDFNLPVTAMAAGCSDAADAARRGPPGDRLGINPKEGRNLSRSKQAITLAVHLMLL
jgi:hypothetical protein